MSAVRSTRLAPRLRVLGLAVALSVGAAPALAQVDHSKMHMPPPAASPARPAANKSATTKPVAKKPPAKKPAAKARVARKPVAVPGAKKASADPHAGHAMPSPAAPAKVEDHAAMGHAMPPASAPPVDQTAMGHVMPQVPTAPVDHAAMDHEMPAPTTEQAVDHAAMGHDMPASPAQQTMDHAAMGHGMPMPSEQPREPIPALTAADRIAAFPVLAPHAAHDESIQSYVLIDRLEAWNADPGTGVAWEASSWIGTDLDRLWLRSEGEHVDGTTESADVEVLYGRSVARWWDVVAGIRHDFGGGPSQTFAAIGVIGLAPYKFEVDATAYVGQSGQTAARLEAEYETLLTNRLILQWQAEAELHGKDDERRGIGAGLSTVEAGLRLRYEFTRKFAPYIGVTWERAYGGTADFRRDHLDDIDDIDDTRIVAGLRIWF